MNPFVKFMQTPAGRVARIVAGVALLGAGLIVIGGTTGYAVAVVGLVPAAAGLFDRCLMAPFFGVPFSGARIRALNRE